MGSDWVGSRSLLAFSFAGQGAQTPGMGRGWQGEDGWELVEQASAVSGRDVARLLTSAGADELRLTRNAQLAILTMGLVMDAALRRVGLPPAVCVGHSVGEYAALISAGALTFEDGIRLVVERAEAMQAADEENPGTMSALVGLDDDDAQGACGRADGDVWVANYNAPGRTVVAGAVGAVRAAEGAAVELGAARVVPLEVGGAYHTRFMAPARPRLRDALARTPFHTLQVPVVANVDARSHWSAPEWPALLSAQLCSPVRWSQSIRRLVSMDVDTIVQLGPSVALGRLVKRSAPGVRVLTVREPADIDVVLALALGGLEELDALGELSERLHMTERLVVSPTTGVYRATPASGVFTTGGEILAEGDVVGMVGDEPVASPFAGWLMGLLASEGQRVRKGQPIAWLRLL
ncbi:MAG TPA: acyltransferase domain-containing protein [Acidimicrobiales bacterium]|nr:acyltransferase domain-containing protein [Acidimicrobiales bacterium]